MVDGTVDTGPTVEIPNRPISPPHDFDNDRRSELLLTDGVDIDVWRVDLTGGWVFEQHLEGTPGCTPTASALEDLDGDGLLDVCVASECEDKTGRMTVFAQDEDAQLQERYSRAIEIPGHLVYLADVDRDGVVDAFVSSSRFDTDEPIPRGVFLGGAGDGSFDTILHEVDSLHFGYEPFGHFSLVPADINGDGIPEAFTSSALPFEGTESGLTYLVTVGAGLDVYALPFEDIDGDGCDDLVGDGLTTLFMPCD